MTTVPRSARRPRGSEGAATLRIGARISCTEAEGPGVRFALWLQGCSLHCPGCCNPHLLDPLGGEVVPVARLLEDVDAVRHHVEGISVLGGEPFDQPSGLLALLRGALALSLGTIVFTGHTLERLTASANPSVRGCLEAIDLLVDGPYEASLPERRRRWVGSTNQRFHYLTSRYSPAIEWAADGRVDEVVEVRIAASGRVQVNGSPGGMAGGLH